MIDIRRAILDALPKDLLLDLEDRMRAEAMKAREIVDRELPLNAKRSREAEGQIRFRLQEQGYEEVVQLHGGHLLVDGVMLGTNLKVFQPFARFTGPNVGVILGFASMPERRKIPPKNMSRAAGVTLNVALQPTLFTDESSPKLTDLFALFLTARDRQHAGLIEEIAIGVIGSNYKDFIFYESLDAFLSGYNSDPVAPDGPILPDEGGKVVKLRQTRKPFIPPEKRPDKGVEDGTAD
ncbi:hypothetical protein FJ420_12215 [Mesorhizobium sp. B3-1-3]|uniref:hypothetical protein n=1 Tax=unclassified Mesorhizobium TaxID=325217 RepID=UPI001128B614|nr:MULTISPECIES: hypothetical protein [unclassified Mesorhizobium]TPI63841.1 hypothetical protein FJ424_18860 [Mesorhizobium sp. B3-1-8]TPI72485.1 hypothetical protein FJ420_12215 [Mesorhizobium sp. B3-1-3]